MMHGQSDITIGRNNLRVSVLQLCYLLVLKKNIFYVRNEQTS